MNTATASMTGNATATWLNPTSWAVNITRFAPSFDDILHAGPRAYLKLSSFVSEANTFTSTDAADMGFNGAARLDGGMEAAVASESDPIGSASRLSLDSARGIGTMVNYVTSRWALSCIAMAVVLNRTVIFAATRRRIQLDVRQRLLIRILPIILFALQARTILQSIQCQTSSDFSLLRWRDASKSSDLMFNHPNSLLNSLASILLFGTTNEQSCQAIRMVPFEENDTINSLRGSLSLLWPLFGTFCLSHFLENMSSAVQGLPITVETGMTLFEQSLAFAEADAAISSQLGWAPFANSQSYETVSTGLGSSMVLTRSMILKRVNTPTEVLLIAFISTMTHLSSHILGVFKLQDRYRLVNTGFWGLCYMGSIVWSAFVFDIDDPAAQGLLRFPTVCLIAFVPHVIVLAGIILCMLIYVIALLLAAMTPNDREAGELSFRLRLSQAHENMQANVPISEIRITRKMDFYSALLRTGLAAISLASEAVYLNEDGGVGMKQHTWLEESRYREAEELQRHWAGVSLSNTRYDQIGAVGLIPIKRGALAVSNGYGRERAAQKVSKARGDKFVKSGVGATERSSRWLMALEFLISIHKLLIRVGARTTLWVLSVLRIPIRPGWLLWLARQPKPTGNRTDRDPSPRRDQRRKNGYPKVGVTEQSDDVPVTEGLDIEAEFRRVDSAQTPEALDSDLYNYWLKGGWWGSVDGSGEYQPDSDDEGWDNTSVVTASTAATDVGGLEDEYPWEADSEDIGVGQRTPTQRSPQLSREGTPVVDSPLAMRDLARLLNPENKEQRDEAHRLSAHLQSERIMTRSSFRRMQNLDRTRVLTTPGSKRAFNLQPNAATQAPSLRARTAKLSPDEEEKLLEQLLLSRRRACQEAEEAKASSSGSAAAAADAWRTGGAGMGADGPQCVVCQSSPRTIIVWPCRCLSLCDDCRVSLAMNNFDKCVCCRREVISFSRIFVP